MQYLYVIVCQDFFKIGVANNVEDRLAQMSTGNPFPLYVACAFEFQNAEPVEKSLHQKFASKKIRGEWFNLTKQDEIEINQICGMLGGNLLTDFNPSIKDLTDQAEDMETEVELSVQTKFDYQAMFDDGWRIEIQSRGTHEYWAWRRGSYSREYIYGGPVSSLPMSIENMRRVYQEHLNPLIGVTEHNKE